MKFSNAHIILHSSFNEFVGTRYSHSVYRMNFLLLLLIQQIHSTYDEQLLFKRAFYCKIFLFFFPLFGYFYIVDTQRKDSKNNDGIDFIDSVRAYTQTFQIGLEPIR